MHYSTRTGAARMKFLSQGAEHAAVGQRNRWIFSNKLPAGATPIAAIARLARREPQPSSISRGAPRVKIRTGQTARIHVLRGGEEDLDPAPHLGAGLVNAAPRLPDPASLPCPLSSR